MIIGYLDPWGNRRKRSRTQHNSINVGGTDQKAKRLPILLNTGLMSAQHTTPILLDSMEIRVAPGT